MLSLSQLLSRRDFVLRGMTAVGFAAWPASGSSQGYSSREDLETVVKEWVDAYNNVSKPEKMLGLLAENIFFEDPTFRLRHVSRESMRKMIEQASTIFETVHVDPGLIILDPPWAALQPTISGQIKQKSSPARSIRVRGATFLRIENRKISQWVDYYDFRTYNEQLRGGEVQE